MKEGSEKGVEQEKKGRRSTVVVLRGEDKEGGMGGNIPDGDCDEATPNGKQGDRWCTNPFRALAKTISLSSWFFLAVAMPIAVIAVTGMLIRYYKTVPDFLGDTIRQMVGNGVLLTFSGVLLVRVGEVCASSKRFRSTTWAEHRAEPGWESAYNCGHTGILSIWLELRLC